NRADLRIVQPGQGCRADLWSLTVIGPAYLFQVDVRNRLCDRKDRMLAVIARAKQALLFAEKGHKHDAAPWSSRQCRECGSQLNHRCSSAAIIVSPIEYPISCSGILYAQVVVMRGDQNVGVIEPGIRAAKEPDHVAKLHGAMPVRRDV